MCPLMTTHRPQLGSKLFVDEQVDEEVGQVVDPKRKAEVAADWSYKDVPVDCGGEGEDEDQEDTDSDLRRLQVARVLAFGSPEIENTRIILL